VKIHITDADRPEDELDPPPVVTPPVPEKRSAYASLIFTACVLIGTVVAIYTVFPARKNETINAALRNHRAPDPAWSLTAPAHDALVAWATGVLGDEPPLPDGMSVVGARALEIRHRRAIYVRYSLGDAHVSYVVQHAADAPADRTQRKDGPDLIEAWHDSGWTIIAIGPDASADDWKPRVGVP
jgi:hypothetical protein